MYISTYNVQRESESNIFRQWSSKRCSWYIYGFSFHQFLRQQERDISFGWVTPDGTVKIVPTLTFNWKRLNDNYIVLCSTLIRSNEPKVATLPQSMSWFSHIVFNKSLFDVLLPLYSVWGIPLIFPADIIPFSAHKFVIFQSFCAFRLYFSRWNRM